MLRKNETIRISPVRVTSNDDKDLGILPTADAIELASKQQMDLVEIEPYTKPPGCKIMSYYWEIERTEQLRREYELEHAGPQETPLENNKTHAITTPHRPWRRYIRPRVQSNPTSD